MLALAGPIDEQQLDQLQSANGKAQLELANKIRKQLNKEQLSAALQTKLVNVLASSDNLAKYGYVEMLSSLAPGDALEPATIIAIAAAVNSSINHRPVSERVLSGLLISYDEAHHLPDKALQHLYEALTTNNVLAAISVLRAMPTEAPRFLANAAALTDLLLHEYPYVRTNAIRALGHYGRVQALPDATNDALVSVSNNDKFMHVRFEAFRALSDQTSLDRNVLARSLANQITQPDRKIWRASSGYTGYQDLEPRAIRLLVGWFETPYPSFVIDTLITKSDRFYAVAAPLLEKVAQVQGFTASQLAALQVIAERHGRPETRQALYALMLVSPSTSRETAPFPQGYNTALNEMAEGKVPSKRIRAAYLLEQQFSSRAVPMTIATVAADMLLNSDDAELRGISARLVATSAQPFVEREQILHRALATHRNDDAIRAAWFSMYSTNELERLVTNNLLDQMLPPWVFTSAVYELRKYVEGNVATRELQPDTVNTLIRVAKSRNDYMLTGAVISLLKTCYIKIPVTLRMYSRSFQSKVLFGIYLFLAVVYLLLGIVTFFSLISVPLSGATGRKRFGLLLFWASMAVAGLALFAWAMLGFLGHNSAPDPSDSLKLNLPLYAGMALLTTIAGFELQWAKRRKFERYVA
jgi:hypothetical protein